MITLKPFKAYCVKPEYARQVAALPYDVMSIQEAKVQVAENPYSFLHIDKPEIHIEEKGDEKYKFASSRLDEMIAQGIFKQESQKVYYIYCIRNNVTVQYGLVGCLSCNEYDAGKIKKHENTREEKEKDRTRHISACHAHTGPIFLAYSGMDELTTWMIDYGNNHEPYYAFLAEDYVQHTIYRVEQVADVEFIAQAFQNTHSLYIADGHHRAAAACNYARMKNSGLKVNESDEYNYFLGVVFSKNQLNILDYNRVLKDESGLSKKEIFKHLEKHFNIETIHRNIYKPIKRHTFGMRYQGEWYCLELKKNIISEDDSIESLDVSILQDYIIAPIFKIINPREDERIDFVGGIRGIEALNQRTDEDMDVAFSMYPTSMDELIKVADEGKLMPPKSTWFEPKLRSGLFIHKF